MSLNWIHYLCSWLFGIRAELSAGDPKGRHRDCGLCPQRSCAGVYPASGVSSPYRWLIVAIIVSIMLVPSLSIGAVQGDKIINRAWFSTNESGTMETEIVVTVVVRTPSTIDLLNYAPLATSGSEQVQVDTTGYSPSGNEDGPFTSLAVPAPFGSTIPFDLSAPLTLNPTGIFHIGEPIFLRITDLDQNLDNSSSETIIVSVTSDTGDKETLILNETGLDTGIFSGYITSNSDAASSDDGQLSLSENGAFSASYRDRQDGSDVSTSAALVDPFGIVFDSTSGEPLNGATVSLVDTATNQPAAIFGDDGVSSYPATVVTGEVTLDSSGRAYNTPAGGFRFPLIAPGSYRLDIDPPPGYAAPSTVATATLQSLPGAPFAIEPGSRGEIFIVNPGPALHIDIPVDPSQTGLWVEKSVNRSQAAIGDFISYRIKVENFATVAIAPDVEVSDVLPPGFRYQQGSTLIDGTTAADPSISADGRTLTFPLGDMPPGTNIEISYITEIGAGARSGEQKNIASAKSRNDLTSNTAEASILIKEEFLRSRSLLMGRVMTGGCELPDTELEGLANVRVYLEDGSYVITDKKGNYHFEGIEPGTHVAQLDLATLPLSYEAVSCEENSQFAGRNFSQFVDIQGGTMWRADFHIDLKPRTEGDLSFELNSTLAEGIAEFSLPIRVGGVALEHLLLTVTLPENATYIPGSSQLAATTLPDPASNENTLTYELGDWSVSQAETLTLRAEISNSGQPGELWASALLTFDTPLAAGLKTPTAENKLLRTEIKTRVMMPDIILRPQFPTFGAELSNEDKEVLDQLVEKFNDRTILAMSSIGHTDNVPIAPRSQHIYKDNFALSKARAESISTYLGEAFALTPAQTTVVGMGAALPVADNATDTGRALNRRVEVLFVTEAATKRQSLELVQPQSGPKRLKTEGLRPGESAPVLEAEIKNDPTTEQPLPEGILYPQANEALTNRIVSVRLSLGSSLKPRLLLDDKEIAAERIGFKMEDKETGRTLYTYIGIDLEEKGIHRLKLEGIGPFGNARYQQELEVIRTGEIAEIRVLDGGENLADGVTPIKVRLQLLDSNGETINSATELALLQGNLLPELTDSELDETTTDGNYIKVDAQGYAHFQPTQSSGRYYATLGFSDKTIEVETYVKPMMRDWILVGFAEGTAGYNTLSGNSANLDEAGIENHFYHDEQVKFFAKGAIKGEWLLTMAYDSDKPNLDGESLHQVIDPDAYYPLYGDETHQRYEAASARKLYVKLERNQFYALFGDMQTGLSQTELSRYNRSMNGFKSELQAQNFSYAIFAADTRQGFIKDEIPGDGTSGRYTLSQPDLVMNSETITIETRDRFHSENIIETQTLTRHSDYDIDYDNGSLFFKRPILSKDENFNPIFIVATYETVASETSQLNYGGRVAVNTLGRKIEVGATHVHEESGLANGNLYGVDASIRLDAKNALRLEAATTDTSDQTLDKSGDAFLAEFEHNSHRLQATTYYREQTEGFGLGQQNSGETGTRKYGTGGSVRLNRQTSISGLAYHQDNLVTDARRDVAELGADYTTNRFSLNGGVRDGRDTLADGNKKQSQQLIAGGNWTTINRKLTLRAAHEQSIGSKNDNADYPTLTLFGADYRLNRKVSLFAEQEFTWGNDKETEGTRAGLKATPWRGSSAHTTIERQIDENGERIFSLFGLGQTWQVNKNLSVDASLDRSYTVKDKSYQFNDNVPAAHGSNDDFTAVSLGATYEQTKWSWSNRVEFRHAGTEDKYGLVSSLIGQVSRGVSASARYIGFLSDGTLGDKRSEQQLSFGLAFRPVKSRWIFLDRLDANLDRDESDQYDNKSWRLVNNLHANYKPNRKWQIAPYYGLKFVRENYNEKSYEGFTDLYALETRYNLTTRWDLGLHGSMLHSWNSNQLDHSYGASVGYLAMTNVWASLGYNFDGFHDEDFSQANHTVQGVYIKFRLKFDQNSLNEALEWMNKE